MVKQMSDLEYQEWLNNLLKKQDLNYKAFTEKLTMTKSPIIGVRVPELRKMAKEAYTKWNVQYLDKVGERYFEEIMLAFLVLAKIRDEALFKKYLRVLLPKLDNWEICDIFANSIELPKVNKGSCFKLAKDLIATNKEFSTRCGIVICLNFYIEEEYLEEILQAIDDIKIDTYYSNMGIAWLLSEMYIRYPEKLEKYLQESSLNDFTINKTISKIKESYRVDEKTKKYLDRYKRKRK